MPTGTRYRLKCPRPPRKARTLMPLTRPAPRDVTINGEPQRVTAVTLADVVHELGYRDARRASIVLNAGDRIEIVTARQGG
jgi:sulfur carrier protein ThiS